MFYYLSAPNEAFITPRAKNESALATGSGLFTLPKGCLLSRISLTLECATVNFAESLGIFLQKLAPNIVAGSLGRQAAHYVLVPARNQQSLSALNN